MMEKTIINEIDSKDIDGINSTSRLSDCGGHDDICTAMVSVSSHC